MFSETPFTGERGYILIMVFFLLLLVAVLAMGMNRTTVLNTRIASNRTAIIQQGLGQTSCVDEALWHLGSNSRWLPGQYSDLTFYKDLVTYTYDTIKTAQGDFSAQGFQVGEEFAVFNSGTVNDGYHTILGLPDSKTIQVQNYSLVSSGAGHGVAVIRRLAGTKRSYFVTLTPGTGCVEDTIETTNGNFAADGFRRGDRIAFFGTPANTDGSYVILNDPAVTPTVLKVPKGSFGSVQSGTKTIARLQPEVFSFAGMTYHREMGPKIGACGDPAQQAIACSFTGATGWRAQAVLINTARDMYVADTENHRIRKVDTATNIITTVAGNTLPSTLNLPSGVFQDDAGNVYVADTNSSIIRKMSVATGGVSIIAGTPGSAGYAGDGGAATAALLNKPNGLYGDASGNLYIADTLNNRIRRVDAGTGIITTVAGTGVAGYTGDGGAATAATLASPYSVFIDPAGHLYVADNVNDVIRKINGATGIITTVAGTGTAGYSGDQSAPTGVNLKINAAQAVRIDGAGNLYIADTVNNRIRKVLAQPEPRLGYQLVTTVAGNGTGAYAGDGGPAINASIKTPYDIALTAAGDVYIADTGNHRIRKVAAGTGIITTVAGTGTAGFSGDGGQATAARLSSPSGVFADTGGNLYIADKGNHVIRKVDAATGVITKIAGTSALSGYMGDGGQATAARLNAPEGVCLDASGNVYIADTGNHVVRKVDISTGVITKIAGTGALSGYTGNGGPATAARLKLPGKVILAGTGDILIADSGNHALRQVTAATGIITTMAGTGAGGYTGDGVGATTTRLNNPDGIELDAAGNLYLADTGNHRIRKVAAGTGIITTVAGSGSGGYLGDALLATMANFKTPQGAVTDAAGNLYIADTGNHIIRMVRAQDGLAVTLAGIGGSSGYTGDGVPATTTKLSTPAAVRVAAGTGHLTIADYGNSIIRRVDGQTGVMTTVAGLPGTLGYAGDGESALAARLRSPTDTFVNSVGNILIADSGNNVVREVQADSGIIITKIGNIGGAYVTDDISALSTPLNAPAYVTQDLRGNYYIADTLNHRIRKVNGQTGIITTVVGNGLADYAGDGGPATLASLRSPEGIFLAGTGDLFIADTQNNRIRKVTAATGIITTIAGTGAKGFYGEGEHATLAKLDGPAGLFVDAQSNLYIADTTNHRIRKVTAATGIITTIAGTGAPGSSGDGGPSTMARVKLPANAWLDSLNGDIYIADTGNHAIRKINGTTGIISTVAGMGGVAGSSGDGGLATAAKLNGPRGILRDDNGNLYIADTGNHVIRKVSAAGIITKVAGSATTPGYAGDGGQPTGARLYGPKSVWVNPTGRSGMSLQ